MALYALLIAINLYRAPPAWDWDLIGYVGVAHAVDSHDPVSVHAATYGEIRAHVPADRYARLVDPADPLRLAIAEDPEALHGMLPLYSVKPLYPALMVVLGRAGQSYVDAAMQIPRVAFVGIAVMLALWLRRLLPLLPALLVAGLLVSFSPLLKLAQYATPDSLSVLLMLGCFYLAIERRAPQVALCVGIVALLARPDNIAFFVPLALLVWWWHPPQRRSLALLGLAGVGTYLAQSALSGNPGWAVTFYRSFLTLSPYAGLDGTSVPLTLSTWAGTLIRQYTEMLFQRDWVLLFLPLAAALLVDRARRTGATDRYAGLLAVNIVNIGVHLLAFPRELDRFLIGAYLAILISMLARSRTE